MAKEWNIKKGLPDYDFLALMEEAFATENIIEWDPEEIVVGAGGPNDARVVLKGSGFVDNDNNDGPDVGIVDTIKVYDGDTLVAKATGYALTLDQLGQAFDHLSDTGDFAYFMTLFFDSGLGPITIDGSNDRDVFVVPEDKAHHFYGNGGNDKFVGGEVNDKVLGGDGKDKLFGKHGADVLKGNAGKDKLAGQQGDDTLVGGAAKDTFIFDVALGNAGHQAGINVIKDFEPGKDIIALDSAIFSAIGGKLNAGEFHQGGNAQDGNDHILYKKSNGKLFHDDNGDGAGGRTLFAILEGKPNLSHTDFDVI
ncbi:calcium-binding protein [Bauldia sp.]|uniref:calcium-binding protein n=1 Tax=Bauldia sp. TaxID=2575872 RepID=UPI003BAC2A46